MRSVSAILLTALMVAGPNVAGDRPNLTALRSFLEGDLQRLLEDHESGVKRMKAFEHVAALGMAGREEEGLGIADALFRLACSRHECSENDQVFIQGSLGVVKAIGSLRLCRDDLSCGEEYEANVLATLALMDELPPDYRVPGSLQDVFNADYRVPALDIREGEAVMLVELGREPTAFRLARELVDRCPTFASPDVCYEHLRTLDREFRRRNSSLVGVVRIVEPRGFDDDWWRIEGLSYQSEVAEELMYSGYLFWKTRSEVVAILGPATRETKHELRYAVDIPDDNQRVFIARPAKELGALILSFDETDRVFDVGIRHTKPKFLPKDDTGDHVMSFWTIEPDSNDN